MKYCETCHLVCNDNNCSRCSSHEVRKPSKHDYCLLAHKEGMLTRDILELLASQRIPYIAQSSTGNAIVLYAGELFEYFRIYVPYGYLNKAQTLCHSLLTEHLELPVPSSNFLC